ncbi:MerC mercury resistance protein [Chryseobacterium sp. P1-3]|uniref:MerC domain-containing protein n=1 Tax=Chryseobacterium gallinarum TaxID=1324352 RepID=A0A0G3M5N6_CHRGL|nr:MULTISPECIES: MerC domain-containing protein [Chryseobacterium]AKK74154.1 MerC mercury resistance protein [Chryseobacterium gallinarum]KFF74625.1 MerC mercury resistance protein [Chryseobacterium sp. P1-3]QIY90033.1 MerC domain-containing protein [Chryseobacterium gallinarum]
MKSKILDTIGISAAVVCLIHCIIFPLLLIVPLGISHNPYIDLAFLLIGAVVVYRVTRTIRNVRLKWLFWVSIFLISVSVGLDLLFEIHVPLIYIGALGLIVAHSINFKNHKH